MKIYSFYVIYVSVCMHVCLWPTCMLVCGGQKRAPDCLELELQAIEMLGTEPGSSARAVSAPNH